MLAALVGLPIFGLLVTIDDDLPGGFSNPNGTSVSPWKRWESWVDLLARGLTAGIGFGLDAGWRSAQSLLFWSLGAVGVISSIAIHRRIRRAIAGNVG
jgi:hypothetical protein